MTDFANLVLGVNTSQLKRGERDLKQFGAQSDRTSGKVDKFGGSAKRSFNAVAIAATAALGAIVSIGSAVRIIADFETSMSRLGAVSRATSGELEALRNIAKDLGSTTEFSASQAADGLNFLAMAGFNATEAMAAIPSVLDLATVSGMGLASAADQASNIMSTFGIAAGNAASVADTLAGASTRANTSVSELAQAITSVGGVAVGMGMDLTETSSALAVLADNGLKGERAGTALRGVLASLVGPTNSALEALEKYSLTAADINPELSSLSEVMDVLSRKNISTADSMTIFGREAASAFGFLSRGSERLSDLNVEFSKLEGAATDAASAIRDNLGGDLKSSMSAAQGLAIALGDAGLTAIIRGLVQGVTALTRGLTVFVENLNYAAIAIAGLTATQIPLAIAGLASMTVGMTGAGIATAVFTGAAKAARLALVALGGPLGIVYGLLGAGAAAWVLWGDNATEGGDAAYDAEAGTKALNLALGTFYNTAAPAAARSAIDLANDNHTLAASAYEAAKAELAKVRALALAGNALLDRNPLTADGNSGYSEAMAENAANALAKVADAEAALEQAMRDRKVAVTAVTGAMSENMTSTLDAIAANQDLSLTIEGLDYALTGGGGAAGALVAATEETEKLTQAQGPLVTAVGGVADAWGRFIVGGLRDFNGFTDSILSSFKGMIAQMIATAAKNKIMIAVGLGGSVAGSAAAANGIEGSVAGSMGGMFLKGATNAISGFSGGIMAGFEGIATAASAAGGSMGMLAAAAGAIAVPLLAVTAAFSFFSTKTSALDEGLRITTTNLNSMVESFDKVKTSRFWGLSTNIHTAFDEMGAAADPLRQTIGDIQTSIMDAAGVFGFGADAFAGFTHEFTLSLKGLDDAAQQAAIADELTKLGNAFTGMTGAFASTQELVTAAAQNYELTNRLLEAQGKSTELLTRQRTAEMDATHALNQPLLARIHNLEDEAAAAEAASMELERLADAAEAVAEAARAAIQGATNAALAPINDMLAASRSAASDARSSANEFFRLADSLREASGNIGGVTTAAELANEGQKFAQMFAAAVSGDVDALGSLGSAGQSLASDSAGFATSALELKRVEAGIRSQLDQGAAVAESIGLGEDYQSQTLELLNSQLEITKEIITSGDMTVDLMRQQIDILSDIGGRITNGADLNLAGIGGVTTKLTDLINVQLLQNSLFKNMSANTSGDVSFSSPVEGNTSGMITFAEGATPTFDSGSSAAKASAAQAAADAAAQAAAERIDIVSRKEGSRFAPALIRLSDGSFYMSFSGDTPAQKMDNAEKKAREAVLNAGLIPSFAGGVRNFAGGLAEIHDGAGGEIVNLPSGAQVIPHDLSRRMVDRSTASNASTSNDDSGVRKDLSELRRVMVEVVKYVKRTSDIERKHDIDGMPPVRT